VSDSHATGAAGYLFEVGVLKRIRRTGWWFTNVNDPESVADHSHRVAIIGALLAAEEGADPARTALLCVFHDTPETRIGDIPHIGRRYLTKTGDGQQIAADQVSQCSPQVTETVNGVVDEFERQESLEAVVAKDADKLECLFQAIEYSEHGHETSPWVESSLASLKTATAREWAEAAMTTPPQTWLKTFKQ
jgi:putative hydrolase of HD superfamily